MSEQEPATAPLGKRNRRVALAVVLVVLAMAGLAAASVPLYDLFCRVTGYGGTTRQAESAQTIPAPAPDAAWPVTVSFDANVAPDMPWDFSGPAPVEAQIGEPLTIRYTATNNGQETIVGTSTFNVTPMSAGSYFVKMECFCFTEQVLKPGETTEFPVTFYVDPGLTMDPETAQVHDITLSYTFFRITDPERIAEALRNAAMEADDTVTVEKPVAKPVDHGEHTAGAGMSGTPPMDHNEHAADTHDMDGAAHGQDGH